MTGPGPDIVLPITGDLVSRDQEPCGDCGEPVFIVVRCLRRHRDQDGGVARREVVDVRCPHCACLSDARDDRRDTIGSFDTTTGILTLDRPEETR